VVSHTKGRTQIEGIWERGVEENIWTEEGSSKRQCNEEFRNLDA